MAFYLNPVTELKNFYNKMIKYHIEKESIIIAELLPGAELIRSPDDILDLIAEISINGSNKFMIHSQSLHPDFFDLKTGMAGEILQKFSNYRIRLAIIGDFSAIKSRSLNDFIRESNNRGVISFVESTEKALEKLAF
jgi:hypothetical protein